MNWKRWVFLLPLAAGLAVSAWMNMLASKNPILFARVDAGTVFLLLGGVLSILAGAGQFFFLWVDRREERLLAEASADRRRFLSRLDHELKNPITALLAGLANIQSTGEKAADQALEGAVQQVQRIRRLIADLRKLSDLETRMLELHTVDVTLLLEDAFESVRSRPEVDDVRMALQIPRAPWPLPQVEADPDLLFLAFYNLLDNALKFCHPGDAVELRAFEDSQGVMVEVADTGPGIPEDEIPFIWDELYRPPQARGIPGSGLGLAIVRAVAHRHGGSVSVRSRAGEGTVFMMHLPA